MIGSKGSMEDFLQSVSTASVGSIIGALREGIVAIDSGLMITAVNQAAAEILGRQAGDLVGVNVCVLFSDQACPRDILTEALISGQSIIDFQTTVRLGPGRHGDILLRTAPLQGQDGEGLGIALILGDVTEVTSLLRELSPRFQLGRLIGRDPKMRELFALISDVAPSEASVLIQGESGTGKELVARALHEASDRAEGPFVQVNCSALAENLLESELFGHVKGAYTGAVGDRRGRFEEAVGGTLFLDEIGDVSPVVQVKLLRVLQERSIERVGDNRPIPVDVRVVSATNRKLEGLLASGRLREDFFYRIKVVSLTIPPLRDRREDVPLLVTHILERIAQREGRSQPPAVAAEAMRLLMNHAWPGNVRELENALEHALALHREGVLQPGHLPPEVRQGRHSLKKGPGRVPVHSEQEMILIQKALAEAGWNRSRAARRLGIDRTTLWRKIREYGLNPED